MRLPNGATVKVEKVSNNFSRLVKYIIGNNIWESGKGWNIKNKRAA